MQGAGQHSINSKCKQEQVDGDGRVKEKEKYHGRRRLGCLLQLGKAHLARS